MSTTQGRVSPFNLEDILDRAYKDVLFSHVDRLGDPCPSDPYEASVGSLLAQFEAVASLDPQMNFNDKCVATRDGQPWPSPGETLWACREAIPGFPGHSKERVPFQALLSFRDPTGVVRTLGTIVWEGKPRYHVLAAVLLSPSETGDAYLTAALTSPKFSKVFTGLLALR